MKNVRPPTVFMKRIDQKIDCSVQVAGPFVRDHCQFSAASFESEHWDEKDLIDSTRNEERAIHIVPDSRRAVLHQPIRRLFWNGIEARVIIVVAVLRVSDHRALIIEI